MPAIKTKVEPVTKETVVAAVQTWAKAEGSAIWALIHIVHRSLGEVNEADRPKRLFALKTWINNAAEEAWGPGASKDRAAHISKILKIAERATPAHFTRWEKKGIGFYKAYEEFAVPQANPASAKGKTTTPPAAAAGTAAEQAGAGTADPARTGKPDVVQMTTGPDGKLIPATVDQAPAAGEAPAQKVEGYTPAQAAAMAPREQPLPPADPTSGWAALIESNKDFWSRLVDKITEKKQTIITPDMVLELIKAIGKKDILFRNTIGVLINDPFIRGHVKEALKETEKAPAKV